MRAGKIVLLVAGILVGLLGAGLLVGGGALVWAHTTQRDAAGYYTTPTGRLSTSTYALTSQHVDLGTSPGGHDWTIVEHLGTVRVKARAPGGAALFVGIGPSRTVDAYLAASAHDHVTDVRFHPFHATYRRVGGQTQPAPPGTESFWIARSAGAGTRALHWSLEPGNWTVVVMNADASRGVRADVSIGAKVGWLFPLGLALLGAGALALAAGVIMTVFALRRPRPAAPAPSWPSPPPPSPPTPWAGAPSAPSAPRPDSG